MLVLAYDKKGIGNTRGSCKLFQIIELKNRAEQELEIKIHKNTIIKARNGLIRRFTK